MMRLPKLALAIIVIILLTLVWKLTPKKIPSKSVQPSDTSATVQTTAPQLLTISPDPKTTTVILPNQTITLTFNLPLVNGDEMKLRVETFKDYRIELSGDKKTAKIIPTKPYPLGQSFTFFISPEAKFEGGKTLGHDEHFSFSTIEYRGV